MDSNYGCLKQDNRNSDPMLCTEIALHALN